MSSDDRPAWLSPGLAIQVTTIIVSVAIGWGTISNKVSGVEERLAEIRQALPNKEAQELRIRQLEDRVARAESEVSVAQTWIQNTRERLAEKGWKP